MMERWQVKIAAVFGVFIIPFVCTILPIKVAAIFEKRGETGKNILSCLMCFGGGVFFATYILHMGPEVRDILRVALIEPYHIKYPLADLIMAVGFFMVMFMEKLVIACNDSKKKQQKKKQREHCLRFNKPFMSLENGSNIDDNYKSSPTTMIAPGNPSMPLPSSVAYGNEENPAAATCPLRGTGDCCSDPIDLKLQMKDEEDIKFVPGENDEGLTHTHAEAAILQDSTSTRSLVLLVALSMHRIFEGMSVGLQHSTHNVWSLFVAVMCHETVIGFSLGLEFVKNKWAVRRIMIACLLCSLIMPLGTIVGILISELGTSNTLSFDIMNGVLQGIATGTFIYVTFFEILQEELSPHDTGVSKLLSVLGGFLVMACLCAIPEEDDMLSNINLLPGYQAINISTPLPGY